MNAQLAYTILTVIVFAALISFARQFGAEFSPAWALVAVPVRMLFG